MNSVPLTIPTLLFLEESGILSILLHDGDGSLFVEGPKRPRRDLQGNPAVLMGKIDFFGNQIDFEFSSGFSVGMGYTVSETRSFSGELTLSGHGLCLSASLFRSSLLK